MGNDWDNELNEANTIRVRIFCGDTQNNGFWAAYQKKEGWKAMVKVARAKWAWNKYNWAIQHAMAIITNYCESSTSNKMAERKLQNAPSANPTV